MFVVSGRKVLLLVGKVKKKFEEYLLLLKSIYVSPQYDEKMIRRAVSIEVLIFYNKVEDLGPKLDTLFVTL